MFGFFKNVFSNKRHSHDYDKFKYILTDVQTDYSDY